MKALASALLVILTAFAAAACDSGDDAAKIPTQDQLIGTWVNDDAGTTRAFEFVASVSADEDATLAARPFAYTLYYYPTGTAPTVAQRGFYTIEEGELVTEVVQSPTDPSLTGQRFANAVVGFDAKKLVIASTSSSTGKRAFVKAADL